MTRLCLRGQAGSTPGLVRSAAADDETGRQLLSPAFTLGCDASVGVPSHPVFDGSPPTM